MMSMLQILISLSVSVLVQCQHFELDGHHERIKNGKERLERIHKVSALYSTCWENALSQLVNGCRKMSDTEQSYLALQFSNCHLERSGLETYPCEKDDFKSCTKKMGTNIIAFQSYTEFFTHVTDICFYLQSDVWRENTEATIEKLSKTSIESLNIIAKSMEQQKYVLTSQEESIKNQKVILQNEKLLKDALATSAESAKDVFQEVRDHAREQKTIFSETFKHIFEAFEKVSNFQKMLLGEFIGLQSFAFYFIATAVSYLLTSAPQTGRARLPLFISLSILIFFERILVKWRMNKEEHNRQLTSEEIYEWIWLLRKIFFLVSIWIIGYAAMRYKDFNRINHNMLQEIHKEIYKLRMVQDKQCLLPGSAIDAFNGIDDITLKADVNEIEEVTQLLEISMEAYTTSTPMKKSRKNKSKQVAAEKRQIERDSVNEAYFSSESTLSQSRYNLRSRRSFSRDSCLLDSTNKGESTANKYQMVTVKAKKTRAKVIKKPAFFSSDDE